MKQKPKVEEATMTEKEHVNVVFIGHVGNNLSQNTNTDKYDTS
jgi:hypothetical protein